jgi:acyl carrier protein
LLRIKPEELKDDVALEDGIGVDSTEMVEALIALEKTFGKKLSPKEITKSSTINDIEKAINSKLVHTQ